MKTVSYTKSQSLVQELDKIEELRRRLLLTPLSPKEKQVLRWNALIDKIYFSLHLSGVPIEKEEVVEILHPDGKKKQTNQLQEVFRFKSTFDYLYQDWLVSSKPVTAQTVMTLYETMYKTRARANEEDLQNSLRYVQANPDNPIVQSALAQILILTNDFFGRESQQISHIIGQLFLYKYGYDFRGMLVLEEYYYKFKDRYNNLIGQSMRDLNVTPWIEFVVDATEYQLNKLLRTINSKDYEDVSLLSNLKINERQKYIINSLNEPGSKITNKMVQKLFKISAITAARDLAKLVSIGLIFSFGKGRSTYYTKV